MKAKYLYLYTATEKAHLSIIENGEFKKELTWEPGRELSRTLSEKFQELLKISKASKEELAGVVIYPGPGSFTGLRIGTSFANALAFGLSIPVFSGDPKGVFNSSDPKTQITPVYGAEPHITKPRQPK